jgi:hypothetical protein
MMIVKTFAAFKKRLVIAVTLLGIPLTFNFTLAESTPPSQPAGDRSNTAISSFAQNETQNATNDKKAASSEKETVESGSDEKKESGGVKKSPLKDFQPSEKIEADQAVDFPYDI